MFLFQVLLLLTFTLHIFDLFSKKSYMQLVFLEKLKEMKNIANQAFYLYLTLNFEYFLLIHEADS